ncbi:hypothetical protein BDV32DRAFT_132407, partial [Aspergillus pseudonomiae]
KNTEREKAVTEKEKMQLNQVVTQKGKAWGTLNRPEEPSGNTTSTQTYQIESILCTSHCLLGSSTYPCLFYFLFFFFFYTYETNEKIISREEIYSMQVRERKRNACFFFYS